MVILNEFPVQKRYVESHQHEISEVSAFIRSKARYALLEPQDTQHKTSWYGQYRCAIRHVCSQLASPVSANEYAVFIRGGKLYIEWLRWTGNDNKRKDGNNNGTER